MGHIYIGKVEFPYRNLSALKKIKVSSFLIKPLLSAKQPNLAKCHEMKLGEKIGKRRVLGNEFFLQFWYLESNHTICQHAVLRPFRFLELSIFFQSSLPSIVPHFSSFKDIPLMYSRDMKPTSKTSIETQVPGRDF